MDHDLIQMQQMQQMQHNPTMTEIVRSNMEERFRKNNIPMPVSDGSAMMSENVSPTMNPIIRQRMQQKFGHIMNGGQREDMSILSTGGGFEPIPEPSQNKRRGPQNHQPKVSNEDFKVAVDPYRPPSDTGQWKHLEDMWAGSGRRSADIPRIAQRPMNGDVDINQTLMERGYDNPPEFNEHQFRSVLERKANEQQQSFADFRQMPEYASQNYENSQGGNEYDRYMMPSQSVQQNQSLINEAALDLAQRMFKSYVQEHMKMEKKKSYFTRIKLKGNNMDNIIKMEDKYYLMELKPVKITNKKKN